MANGPFGNPLSTGIALSFEVDMTPYREMHKRKLLAAKEKEEDQKKKQQQYADILKNITPPDASKIHKKYMPEVQNQYAELIDSAMGYINKNDMASLHKHMFEFDSNAKKAVQATENYKNYVNSDANKTFKSIEAIRAMEDDNTALSQIAKDYQNDVEYGDGYLFWSTIERPDLLGETNKILQGAEKTIVFDGGKPVVMGRMPETDEVIYKESVKDPDKVLDYLSGWLMSSPGGNRLLMEYGGINAGQLDERTPDGMQKRAALAREYVSKEIEPKLYGQKISKIRRETQPKTGADFIGGIGMKQTGAGETVSMQIPNYEALRKDSSPLVSGIISNVTDENELKKLNKNLDPSGVQFENVIDRPGDNKDYVSINYGGESKEFVIGDEASVKGAVDWLVKQGISDAQLEEFTRGMGIDVPKSSQDLINFTDQIRIQSTGKTDISKKFTLPAGDIIAKGTSGAKMVNIKNKIPVIGASIDNIGVDDSGKLWATISYPVKEDDGVLTKLFGNKNDIESFKKSAGSLPTTFIVPYDEDIKSTVLSLDKNMTEALLDQKLSALKGASGTQSSEYTQITKLKDASGNSINAGVKGGKWYNIDTGEEIK